MTPFLAMPGCDDQVEGHPEASIDFVSVDVEDLYIWASDRRMPFHLSGIVVDQAIAE